MTQGAPKKFAFDNVFDDAGSVVGEASRYKHSYTAAEAERLKAQAFAEGQRAAFAQAEHQTAEALGAISHACSQALGALARVAHNHRESSADLAMAVGRKIADAALECFPQAPVAAALTDLAREIEAKPVLKVRVAPELVERVQAVLEQAAVSCGYPGQITVSDDPDLPLAAFCLDWGEGKAEFNPEAAAARIAEALDTALAAEGLHAEPLISTSEADHG